MRMTLGVGVILGMAAFAALASPWPFLAPFVVLDKRFCESKKRKDL